MTPRPELSPEHWSQERKDIHELIKEFRENLTQQKYELPVKTEGVVALSAPHEIQENKIIEKTPENIARINYSIDIIKQITAKKVNKPIEEITAEDILEFGPPLILNGETEQLPAMKEVALEAGFPEEKIQLVNSGNRGLSNTKTQFENMNLDEHFKKKHFTYITTSYHTPRVARTAQKNLQDIDFEIIGVPYEKFKYNVYRKVRGEVKRILEYSEKGDMDKFIK